MVSARAWRQRAAAKYSRSAARKGASGSVPDPGRIAVVIERLRRRGDFRAAAGGAKSASRAFVLQARGRGDRGTVRVGYTVTRQVGGAVERNRIRRRLREVVRLSAAGGAMSPGHDYVLIGRRAALTAPFTEMTQALHAALAQIHSRLQGQNARPERLGTGSTHSEALHAPGAQSPSAGRRNQGRSRPAKPMESPSQGR
jgi:ribonuclease P protein component